MKHLVLVCVALATMCGQVNAQNKVRNLSTSTQKLNVEMLQNTDQTVSLNRYFFAGYNTLCLPMSMTAAQLEQAAEGLRVERLAAIQQEGSELNLIFVDCTADGIQAGVPYLVYSPKSQTLRALNTDVMNIGTEVRTVRLSDNEGNTVAFSSSWESMAKVGRYGIPAQQNVTPLESVLVRTEADKTFLPTRCGFTWEQQSATASNLVIRHAAGMQEVSAIRSTMTENNGTEVYDLNGRRMGNAMQKGIYVKGGEKVVLK